jgi:phospholipid/cholesterol/gamma-HCH transport system substrate-binding protein
MKFNLSKEVKVALLVITSIAIFVWGLRYLQEKELFTSYRTYYAVFDDVAGLEKGAAVTISGLKIGTVDAITFHDDKARVKVTMAVKGDFKFSETSEVVINGGLIGGSTMKIVPDFKNNTIAKSGFTFQGKSEGMMDALKEVVGEKLTGLESQIDTLMNNTNKMIVNINDILDEKTKGNIKQSLAELKSTLVHFKHVAQKTDQLLADNKIKLDATISNTEKITKDLSKVTTDLSEADFKKTMKDLEDTIASFRGLAKGMEKGEGSIGKLMKDTKMYDNLTGASKQLEELLKEMKLHPKRFVHFSLFGKKDKGYKTTENKTQK